MRLKLLSLFAGLLMLLPALANAQTCPASILSLSPTSCWVPATTGTTIPDLADSNPLLIMPDSSYALLHNTIACNTQTATVGCDLQSQVQYTNPAPMTLIMSFSGTSGPLAQFGSQPRTDSLYQYFELYLDNYGRLSWGVDNYGSLNVLQNDNHQAYADGNQHIAVVTLGQAGMKMYVDGQPAGSLPVQLANYAQGYWYFGGAVLNGASPSGNSWPYSPARTFFNGTIYYAAWINGTQITDAQAESVSQLSPITNIPNSYVNVTGQVASLVAASGLSYASLPITFKTAGGPPIQQPGCSGGKPIASSTQTYFTDKSGNLPANIFLQQGAHVNMTLGQKGTTTPPTALIMPCQSSITLNELIPPQSVLQDAVSAIDLTGPLFAGATVTNPPAGTIGPATINAPLAASQDQATTATVDIQANGNVQQVVMSGDVTVALTDFQSGAVFNVDIAEDGTGGSVPIFTVPSGWSLQWPGGGAQPGMPSTNPDSHSLWEFVAVSPSILVGTVTSLSTASFPLASTGNANGYSIANLNSISFEDLTSPTPAGTATCGGTCATQYTYEVTCNGDNGTRSLPGGQLGLVNAVSLDSTNFNTISWADVAGCQSYTVYGRVNGSLGLLETCPAGPNCDSANSYHDPGNDGVGAAPPTFPSTGGIKGDVNISGDAGVGGNVNANGSLNGSALFVDGAGTFEAGVNFTGGAPQIVVNGGGSSTQEIRLIGTGSAHSYAMEVQNNDTWKLGDRNTTQNIAVVDQATDAMNFPQGIESALGGNITTSGGTLPAISCAAGGTATVTANSTLTSGSFTVGSTTTGNCTLTFAIACAHAINCARPDDSSATIDLYGVPSSTNSLQVTQNAGANLANHKIYYLCGCN